MSSTNVFEVLDEGKGFEVVHRKPSSASTKRSKSSGAGDPVERGVCSKKRVVSATVKSLEALPPESSSTLCPPLEYLTDKKTDDDTLDLASPMEDQEGTSNVSQEPSIQPSLSETERSLSSYLDAREEVENGFPVMSVDRLVTEIQQMHLVVQELLTGSGRTEVLTQEVPREGEQQQLDESLDQSSCSNVIQQEKEVDIEQFVGKEKKREELKKAIAKMKRLDERLSTVMKREREVKEQRKLLQQQMAAVEAGLRDRQQLGWRRVESRPHSNDQYSPHSVSPVFQTELTSGSLSSINQEHWDHRLPTGKENAGGRLQTFTTGEKGRDVGEEDGVKEVKRSRKHEKDLGGPDFIKRNIELAGDAGSSIAMTEEEKKRLEALLNEDDIEEKTVEGKERFVDAVVLCSDYGYDRTDMDRLRDIDSRLTLYNPHDDMDRTGSLLSSAWCQQYPIQDDITGVMEDDTVHPKQTSCGDSLVAEVKTERDEQQRLKEIDYLLEQLHRNNEEAEVTRLSPNQCRKLIEQCTVQHPTPPVPTTESVEELEVVEEL